VDLDRCSGCKACVTACHSLNGLDDGETWRDVGLLIGGTAAKPVIQHVTTACHHCLDPACQSACPVDAYERDPVTGIVRHLDDQCFGCQYCTLACPYDVPKYNAARGIVRKCDMCSQRLSVGEAPACVQACPNEAIAIRIVTRQQVLDDCEAGQFLPGAPDPQLTRPTTQFRSTRPFPRNTLPADWRQVSTQHPHGPLIVMLVLTQLSVGAFTAGWWKQTDLTPAAHDLPRVLNTCMALGLGLLALTASLLHLGRPQYAWRAVIGLRHSWLSREIIAFSAYATVAVVYSGLLLAGEQLPAWLTAFVPAAGGGVVICGAAGVFCSVMIYVSTHREFWSLPNSLIRFSLTACVLGLATYTLTFAGAAWSGAIIGRGPLMSQIGELLQWLMWMTVAKLGWEFQLLGHLWSPHTTSLRRTAELHLGPLANQTLARVACGVLGGLVLPWLVRQEIASAGVVTAPAAGLLLASFGALLAGELLERYLYFAAVAAPRMPGAIRT
jgi:Fe-S-cluster-containing dehydrogenase component/DMSO reductase anchor subunit